MVTRISGAPLDPVELAVAEDVMKLLSTGELDPVELALAEDVMILLSTGELAPVELAVAEDVTTLLSTSPVDPVDVVCTKFEGGTIGGASSGCPVGSLKGVQATPPGPISIVNVLP